MKFKIVWSKKAISQAKKIDKKSRKKIHKKLSSIRNNPYAFTKRLFGMELYSLRVGGYRVIMNIRKNVMTIFIVKVGHRRKVYKKLKK